MKKVSFTPTGVCTQLIEFEIDESNKVHNIKFTRGCSGNLGAISKLCDGRMAEELVSIFSNHLCGMRSTSCVDQFSKAIKENMY